MKKLTLTTVLAFFCFTFLFSQERKPEQLRLTLNECLIKVLEYNLDISVDAFNPEIQEFSIRKSREGFMPRLSFGYNNYNRNELSNWFVQGTQYQTKINGYEIGLRQNIITGGEISLFLSNQTTDTTQSLVTINPSYRGELRLEFSQPLLKDFGPKISRRNIRKAQNQRDISVFGLKSTLIQKVYEVEEAYWNLVRAIENLKVREYSLAKSIERLKINKEAARIGTKTPLDVLSSETEVAGGESNVLSARSQMESSEDRLRKIINLPADASGIPRFIVPTDRPLVEKKEITFEKALKIALEERPELSSKQKEIENSGIDVSYFKNQLLPQLDLRFQLWYPGQSGDRLVYRGDNPYTGDVIDIIKGSRSDSMNDVFGLKYNNWFVTLNLNIPLSNFLSRASLAEARMAEEQKLLEKERSEKYIYHELLEVFKELKNNEKGMDASVRYRELMEKKLEVEEQRYRLGLGSADWLFTFQERLVSARLTEIGAIINYKLSVGKLERVLGINLKTKNIKFRNYDF